MWARKLAPVEEAEDLIAKLETDLEANRVCAAQRAAAAQQVIQEMEHYSTYPAPPYPGFLVAYRDEHIAHVHVGASMRFGVSWLAPDAERSEEVCGALQKIPINPCAASP
jgi:hypothetical protein